MRSSGVYDMDPDSEGFRYYTSRAGIDPARARPRRYAGDDEPYDESEAIYEIEEELGGECSRCGRREALALTVGLDRYCGDCAEQIAKDW